MPIELITTEAKSWKIIKETILILLPGVHNNSSFFREKMIPHFSDSGYKCISVNMEGRNNLFSQKPNPKIGKISLEDDVEHITRTIIYHSQKYPKAEIFLVGHSRGGLLAMMIASNPQLANIISGLVLLCPATPYGIKKFSFTGFITFAGLFKYGFFWNKPVARSFWQTRFGVLDHRMTKEEAIEKYHNLLWESGKSLFQLTLRPPKVDFEKIICPILIIGGEKDLVVRPKSIRDLAEKSKADWRIFEDVSHYLFYGDDGEKIINFIDNWLRCQFQL